MTILNRCGRIWKEKSDFVKLQKIGNKMKNLRIVSKQVCDNTWTDSEVSCTMPVNVYSYKGRKRGRPPNYLTSMAFAAASIILLSGLCAVSGQRAGSVTEYNQTSIRDKVTFTLDKSPYLIVEDVIVDRTGHLIIEPGVEVRFMPEAGLTVWGILSAEGLPDNKIKFVAAEEVDKIQPNRTIRLVDGPSINEGVVQVKVQLT